MRVLLVNTSERVGGAAIATHRLMRALNNNGVKAKMLVRDKQTEHPCVINLPASLLLRLKFVAERAEIYAANRFSRDNLWAIDTASHGTDITSLPEFEEADLVHLNWINQGMLSLADIRKVLASGKPVVWTLHDMWPCTGICHHAEYCQGWLTGCGNCPKLTHPADGDLSARTYRRKKAAYAAGKVQFVACSDWLADIARRAPLLEGHTVDSIPNAIDTRFYEPGNKQAARQQLGLPADKKLLLFVAYKATDVQKGINYLIETTEIIARQYPEWRQQLGVIPVGREAGTLRDAFACEAYPQEYVTEPEKMRLLYQAADLLVMPTLMDNLPNTIVEGMSCGLPCVGFRVGGLPQMIREGVSGYLARYKDAQHLAELTLDTLVSSRYEQLCRSAHEAALANYSEQVVATRYIRLYEKALSRL
ncbi:MAG: glycosyltransferase family 4 protein [Alloprevotella sp.]|nr:glycosyltransferase family 4 protein [Alloprevotella sp.]